MGQYQIEQHVAAADDGDDSDDEDMLTIMLIMIMMYGNEPCINYCWLLADSFLPSFIPSKAPRRCWQEVSFWQTSLTYEMPGTGWTSWLSRSRKNSCLSFSYHTLTILYQ